MLIIRQLFSQFRRLLAAGLLFALSGAALAETRLLILLSERSGAYLEVAQAIQAGLNDKHSSLVVDVADTASLPRSGPETSQPNLVVAIGVKAAEAAAHLNAHPPVLNLLIPRQSFERLVKPNGNPEPQLFSAIYLDQPYARQLDLIKLMLPGRVRVGVLSGPASREAVKRLSLSARQKKIQLVTREISSNEELLPTLQLMLPEVDVLLAVPEPAIFNNANIQGILLTTYRYKNPMLAFSPSYVRAGALAALYTSPAQMGAEAADVISKAVAGKSITLPLPRYPKDFSISINQQVARSLEIFVDEESILYEKLKRSLEQDS